MNVRRATANDVAACVELVEQRRHVYQQYEPRFWKKSDTSARSTTDWFAKLVKDASNICLVAEEGQAIVGFLIAREHPTPPVYEPGGPTALIDDFCVIAPDRWSDVGTRLLDAAREKLKRRGFAQIVLVGAHKDRAKSEFLNRTDLSLASTWWTAAT